MDKAFEHDHAVGGKALHALVHRQRKTVKAARQHAVLQALLELLGVLKVRRLGALADVAELADEEQAVTAEIVEQARGLVVDLVDEFVGVGEDGAAADALRLGSQPLARLGGSLAAQQPRPAGDLIRQRGAVADDDLRGRAEPNGARLSEAALGL